MRGRALIWLILAALSVSSTAAAQCVGDCDGDGVVNVAELVIGVGIALGAQPAAVCPGLADEADQVSVARLIQAVSAALDGCPPAATATPGAATPSPSATISDSPSPTADSSRTPTAPAFTATPSRSASPTATLSATATPSATPSPPVASPTPTPTATAALPNQPPRLPTPFLYRGFAGQPIALPLAALDPEGGAVHCAAPALAAGMTLGEDSVLRWTPDAAQLGPQTIPFTCADDASPPAAVDGALALHIAADDACVTPRCDAASGCTATLSASAISCCDGAAGPRVADFAPAICPLGRALQIGRNAIGFGPLQNCDRMRVRVFGQNGAAELALHVRVACVAPDSRVTVSARLQAGSRGLAVDGTSTVTLPATAVDGYLEKRNLRFAIRGGGPYFDLGETEGNLTVSLRDPSDGATITRSVRVVLTFGPVSDLPD